MDEILDLYTRHAERYDRERSRSLMERPYLDAALERMPSEGRVLDLGCGPGEPIARYFVERGHAVVGVDAAAPMVELCRARFPTQRWIHADMRGLKLGERFDLIVAWDSFFHLGPGDQREMFSTFELHASPGSQLLFTSGDRDGVAIGTLCGDELYHSSLAPEEYRRLLGERGYRVLRHRANDPECGGHTVWLAQRRDP